MPWPRSFGARAWERCWRRPAGGLRSQLRYANSLGVPYALILGEEELNQGVVVLRDMARGEQRPVPMSSIVSELANAGRSPEGA